MKLGRLKVAVAIYLNGGCEAYELLDEIRMAQDEDGEDIAEFISQLIISEYAEELEEWIDSRRSQREVIR